MEMIRLILNASSRKLLFFYWLIFLLAFRKFAAANIFFLYLKSY